MLAAGNFIPQCKLAAITNAAIAACDRLDGVADGVIAAWQACRFDARTLVGAVTACGTITATDADLVNKIWQGPRDVDGNFLWYGPVRGTDLGALNNTVTAANGTTTGLPFFITLQWFQYWLKQNPTWDWHTITDDQYQQLFQQSVVEFSYAIATDDPNLTAFNNAHGKILLWHGLADQLIYPQGTLDYYQRVQQTLGERETSGFARLFLAPGVQHCGGGPGSAPVDPLAAVVDWVEHHHAPDSIPARHLDTTGAVSQTRPLCAYPQVARYLGHGDTNDARNFRCTRTFG
jgi:feruloyl esterase